MPLMCHIIQGCCKLTISVRVVPEICTGVPAKWNITPSGPQVHLALCMTPPNILTWQLQKLSQTKILITCPFFYLSKPKQINNFQCIHFIQQGNLTVYFGMTDVKNSCVFLSCCCA